MRIQSVFALLFVLAVRSPSSTLGHLTDLEEYDENKTNANITTMIEGLVEIEHTTSAVMKEEAHGHSQVVDGLTTCPWSKAWRQGWWTAAVMEGLPFPLAVAGDLVIGYGKYGGIRDVILLF